MVVVALVAILGTIAVSTYRSYILRTNRTEGRMALLATQVAQEKYFLQNNQYAPDIATVIAAPPAGLGINLTAARRDHGRQLHAQLRCRDGQHLYAAGRGHRAADQRHGGLPDLHDQRTGAAYAGRFHRLLALSKAGAVSAGRR